MSSNAEIAGLLFRPSRYWTFPFRYEQEGTVILDANGERIMDVRGWGLLTGRGSGAHGLPEAEAASIQDQLGCAIANLLNDNWPTP